MQRWIDDSHGASEIPTRSKFEAISARASEESRRPRDDRDAQERLSIQTAYPGAGYRKVRQALAQPMKFLGYVPATRAAT